jgi:hypothetical protein
MNAGDTIVVDLSDSPAGLHVALRDQDTHQSGSMTASVANGFQQVVFDPGAATCSSRPYAFHPMYSTASEHTRVPWAAHSYNVAFSDEIGHFEYCPHVHSADGSGDLGTFVCDNIPTASDPPGADADDKDGNCAPAALSTLIRIDGCTGTDGDFDGPAYKSVWPGSTRDTARERRLDPSPVRFTSPLIRGRDNFQRAAFEVDMPAIEASCNVFSGDGCTNPPPGAQFYPIFSTTRARGEGDNSQGNQSGDQSNGGACSWQFGGPFIPNTSNAFGGTSVSEYGTQLLQLAYPRPGGPSLRFNDYRRVLASNPCPASSHSQDSQD